MPIKSGLKSLAESTPNFSNQALENAINELKIGWVAKSIDLDTSITNNNVLTSTQKNDVKETINNVGYLNAGRYLNDIVRHTNTILDGSILPIVVGTENFPQGTFLEILQLVQGLQVTIPSLYGVPASEKGRSVNDHLGILNNMFTATEDSSQPVFDSLKDSINFINGQTLSTDTALQTAIDNLKGFIDSVVADSTDFQQTLDTFASAVATANTNLDTALQSYPNATKRTQMIADRDSIVTQLTLENSNLVGLRDYVETQSNNLAYTSLADNNELRGLMAKVAQNANWQAYFNDYTKNSGNINPIYTTDTDSDKSSVIDSVLLSRGLTAQIDYFDLESVIAKAVLDNRIDTAGFDSLTNEQTITKCCELLNIRTSGNVFEQSRLLLENLKQQDRDIIAAELDLNQSSDTLS